MVFILAAILIFGVLIAVHELGHFLAAKASGVKVNEFAIGMGPAIFRKTRGETEYSLRLLPIGGYCAMEGEEEDSQDERSLSRQGFWKKLIIFAAGSVMNFLTGLLIIAILYSGVHTFISTRLDGLAPEFPAQSQGEQGLLPGDQLYRIDGERIYLYSDIDLFLSRGDDTVYDIEVLRNGEKVALGEISLPVAEYTSTEGETYQGRGLYFGYEEATFGLKLKYTWYNAIDFVRLVRYSIQELFTGGATMKDLSGPVGIVSTITEVGQESETAKAAVENILYFGALIAINLAVMNLLPLPALDGGKIFFLVINQVAMTLFRRKIPEKYENYVHVAGFVALMGLMLFVTLQDIWKLVG